MYEYGKRVVKKIKEIATGQDGVYKKMKKKLKKKKKKKISQSDQVNLDIKDIDVELDNIEEEFNLSQEGKIEYAKIHASANKPLRQIQDFNSETKFCPCCNLPSQQEGVLVPFSFCDNTDKFAECGEGVSLYFIFFKFCIITLFVASAIIGTTNIFFNYKYSQVLLKFCNNYLKTEVMTRNDNTFLDECKLYFTEAEKDSTYFTYDNQFFFQFSSVNIKNYRKIYSKIYSIIFSNSKNSKFEKIIFNVSIMNYTCLITIFIFNLVFIYYIFNKNKSINYKYLRPSDYSVYMSNLYDIHKRFLEIKKEIKKKNEQVQVQKEIGTTDNNIENDYKERLGINIPLSEIKSEADEFKCFLKNKICIGNYNEYNLIYSITLCPKLDKYKKLEQKIEEISQKITKIKYDEDQEDMNNDLNLEGDNRKYFSSKYNFFCFHCRKTEEVLGDLNKQKEERYKELDELYQDTKKNTIDNFAGCAFITFTSLKEKNMFLKNFQYSICGGFIKIIKNFYYMIFGCCINKSKKPISWLKEYISFEQADEPSDIIYENLEFTKMSKILRTFGVYVLSFVIAIFSDSIGFAIIAGLNALLDYINKKFPHPLVQYGTSFVISCFSTILNYIYKNIFHILTKFERQTTWTQYYLSYSIKLTIFSFINSGILPLLGEIYNPSEGHKTLINNMFMMFVVNSIYTPIRWSLDFTYFGKKISIWLIERKKDPDEEHAKTQKELNDLYELPNMNISLKYSYIAKTLLMAFLYIPIFPFGIVISFLGFGLGYLLEKLNFCIIYKKPEMLGAKICKFYVDYFIFVLFVYSLGDYFFLGEVYDTKLWSYINLITFGVLIFVPYIRILSQDSLKLDKYDLYKKEYKDCLEFNTDYERANPLSKKEGKLNYLKQLKEKNIITDKELLDSAKDIYNVNIMQIYYKNKDKNKEQKSDENKNKENVIGFNNQVVIQNNEKESRNSNNLSLNQKRIKISKVPEHNQINSNDNFINNIDDNIHENNNNKIIVNGNQHVAIDNNFVGDSSNQELS